MGHHVLEMGRLTWSWSHAAFRAHILLPLCQRLKSGLRILRDVRDGRHLSSQQLLNLLPVELATVVEVMVFAELSSISAQRSPGARDSAAGIALVQVRVLPKGVKTCLLTRR